MPPAPARSTPLIALGFAAFTFACTFMCALGGTLIRSRLPEPHLSKESQDVVRLGMGLVATMTALLLGLITASAKSTFDSQDAAFKNSCANVLSLDRHLARFGDETAPTRSLIRGALAARIEGIWPSGDSSAAGLDESGTTLKVEDIENQILALAPQSEAQRWHRAEALRLSEDILKTRWRILGTSTGSVPRSFLIVVIFWLTATFASFGLYAPRNATVFAVFLMAALSVAAAVFMILELDGPLDGLVRISSGPMRYTLAQLGQ